MALGGSSEQIFHVRGLEELQPAVLHIRDPPAPELEQIAVIAVALDRV